MQPLKTLSEAAEDASDIYFSTEEGKKSLAAEKYRIGFRDGVDEKEFHAFWYKKLREDYEK